MCFYQAALNKAIEQILNATTEVGLWKYADLHFQQQHLEAEAARKMGEDIKTQIKPPKPIHKQIRSVPTKDLTLSSLTTYYHFCAVNTRTW